MSRSVQVAAASLCAALYAVVGYASYLGIFAPAIGVVRFWPSVFVPAVFAAVFGPWVGGVGAAIGIFISDMVIHGNALLSLTVGVPANFAGFYVLGALSRLSGRKWLAVALVEQVLVALLIIVAWAAGFLSSEVAVAYSVGMGITVAFTLAYGLARRGYEGLLFACSTGLLVGSVIIGIGVYAFSQFFVLPTGARNLPLEAALLWMIWTYATEIPFMVALTPPIVSAVSKAIGKSLLLKR